MSWVASRLRRVLGREHRYEWLVVLRESVVTVRGLARGPQTVVLRALEKGDERA